MALRKSKFYVKCTIGYWIFIILLICIFVIVKPDGSLNEDKIDKNSFFHIENITLGFIGCFIGGLSATIVGIIFSYGLVFKSLFEVRKDPDYYRLTSTVRDATDNVIKRGYDIEEIVKGVIYAILIMIVIVSSGLGFYFIFFPWSVKHYVVLKGVLIFLLVGTVPLFIGSILALLIYPCAPLKQLLYVFSELVALPPLEPKPRQRKGAITTILEYIAQCKKDA